MSFFDENSMVRANYGENSENGPLFTAEYLCVTPMNSIRHARELCGKIHYDTTLFQAQPPEKGIHFSHDNMTGLYILYKMAGLDITDLPIIFWNGRYNLHPRDIIFYLYMRTGFKILIPLLIPFLIHSCLRPREETSGKCLWFVRSYGIGNKYFTKLYHALLKIKHPLGGVIDVFSIYFPDINHPIHKRLRSIYGK